MYGNSWLIFVLPAMLLAFYSQSKIKSSYAKYSKISSGTNLTGADVARTILDRHGLMNVKIEQTPGTLTDHYDPRKKVLRLSSAIYRGSSIASMSVAAHEVGHAIQDAERYAPLTLRNTMAPIVNFGSKFVWVFILLGLLLGWIFVEIGIILFLGVVLFQIVTLPVEFDASKRALLELENGISPRENLSGAKSMLNAAAFTYIASTLVAISQLLRLLSISNRRR